MPILVGSTNSTTKMMPAFWQRAPRANFFSLMFQSPSTNFYNSRTIQIDISRGNRRYAPVITDLSKGYHFGKKRVFTNKEFIPPVIREATDVDIMKLLDRYPGDDPFKDKDFMRDLTRLLMEDGAEAVGRMQRTIELMCSQVILTGVVSLPDELGNAGAYEIDYKPKSSHFPTAATPWDQAGANIRGDILNLAEQVDDDGMTDVDTIVFGTEAWETAIKDETFNKCFDTRRIDTGTLTRAEKRPGGAEFRGDFDIGSFTLNAYTYNGKYEEEDGSISKFMDPKKVVVMGSEGRRDLYFGGIPRIIKPQGTLAQIMRMLPNRLPSEERRVDVVPNVWSDDVGENIFAGWGTRPLAVPTSIDSFGTLDTDIA